MNYYFNYLETFAETGNLDHNGSFTLAWQTIKELMFTIFEWFQRLNINGVSLLYINLGFVLLITLFAVLLPTLRMGGADELKTRGRDSARNISNSYRNSVISARGKSAGNGYRLDSDGRVHRH